MWYAPLNSLNRIPNQSPEMPSDSGRTTSVWMETGLPQFSPLDRDIRVNVCIVGAGIAGMTCAYLLARTGRTVIVIDDGPIAGGETGRTLI